MVIEDGVYSKFSIDISTLSTGMGVSVFTGLAGVEVGLWVVAGIVTTGVIVAVVEVSVPQDAKPVIPAVTSTSDNISKSVL
jgi:hypothetical protein